MRLHLVALPHTQTTRDYLSCAYTQKIVKAGKMFTDAGHEVILYSGDENDAPCAEHVALFTEKERSADWGAGFDTVSSPLRWDSSLPYWSRMNERAKNAIDARAQTGDYLLLIAGWAQKPIADGLSIVQQRQVLPLEWGVGYEGIFSEFCAFESYAWMHHVYGRQQWATGRFYDAVIPNFFDRDDFPRLGHGDGGYLLYLGRLVHRKGVEIAWQIEQRTGRKLIVAGPGALEHRPGYIHAPEFELHGDPDQLEYVGEVRPAARAELIEHAHALLAPTLYLEPFGGVAVEAMLAGTPAITSDFGAFTETVEDGVTGFRFRTLAQAAQAVERAGSLNRHIVRQRTLARFSLEAVGPMFDRWFTDLDDLWDGGWDA